MTLMTLDAEYHLFIAMQSVVTLNVVLLSVVAPQPSQKIIILSQFRLKNYWTQPSSMKQTLMQVITKMINSSVGVSRKNANDSQVQCSQASLSQVKRSGDRVFPVLSKKIVVVTKSWQKLMVRTKILTSRLSNLC